MPGKFAPTITHHFIAMLEEKGSLDMPGRTIDTAWRSYCNQILRPLIVK